jgi:polyisoprenoid-binding protein YceI
VTAQAETPVPVGTWSVDPQRSEIGFAAKDMWGLRTVRGAFGDYEGRLTVSDRAIGGELTIDAASLETGNKRRDRHLRSPAFFDVERSPRVRFIATALAAREGALALTGELVIGRSRARLEIPVNLEHRTDGALRVEGRTNVSRQSAGLGWNMLGMIRGEAMLHARLTLERNDA